MRKGLVFTAILLGIISISNAQEKPATVKPLPRSTAPSVNNKDVPASPESQLAILKAQRALQGAQLQETSRQQKAIENEKKAEQQAETDLKQALADLNTAVEKARKEANLPDSTPFDQMKLAFSVPVK